MNTVRLIKKSETEYLITIGDKEFAHFNGPTAQDDAIACADSLTQTNATKA